MSARACGVLATVLALLGCGEPYQPPSGQLIFETDDGEAAEAIALLRFRVGDVEEVELLTDPLLDRRGVASLRFPLTLTPDEWRALVEEEATLAPDETAQYRLAREDGAIVRRAITSIGAVWVAPGALVFEGELGAASPRPEDAPPPALEDVATTATFEARWDVVVHCQIVAGDSFRNDTRLEDPACRALIERAGFAQCLEPAACD